MAGVINNVNVPIMGEIIKKTGAEVGFIPVSLIVA